MWSEEKIVLNLKEIINSIGKFPLYKDLNLLKKHTLSVYIVKTGGMAKYRKIMGFPDCQKKSGYWKNIDNVINAIIDKFPEFIQTGKFPPCRSMLNAKMSSVVAAITKYHGGTVNVARLMNCNNTFIKTSDGHNVRSSFEYDLDQFLFFSGIEHQYEGRISENYRYLYDFKVNISGKRENFHYVEIWGMDRNYNLSGRSYRSIREKKEKIYKDLKLNLISFEKSDFNKKPEELAIFFNDKFKENGWNGQFCLTNSNNFWKDNFSKKDDLNEIQKEIEILINNFGEFPSSAKLQKMNMNSIVNRICNTGGFPSWREKLKLPLIKKKNGHWTEDKICKEIINISKKYNGILPSSKKLFQDGHSDLIIAMVRNGGVNYFRNLTGMPILQRKNKCKS